MVVPAAWRPRTATVEGIEVRELVGIEGQQVQKLIALAEQDQTDDLAVLAEVVAMGAQTPEGDPIFSSSVEVLGAVGLATLQAAGETILELSGLGQEKKD
jgi:hypothetical protein